MVVPDKNPFPINDELIFEWLSKIIVEHRNMTYPMLCDIIDGFANSLKQDMKILFDEQGNLIKRELND